MKLQTNIKNTCPKKNQNPKNKRRGRKKEKREKNQMKSVTKEKDIVFLYMFAQYKIKYNQKKNKYRTH